MTNAWSQQATSGLQSPLKDHGSLLPSRNGNEQSCREPFILIDLITALYVMRDSYFEFWVGTWPESIDWTAAVMGTQVSAAVNAISASCWFDTCPANGDGVDENLINAHFAQIPAFYFGENAIGLRAQAYDDMLWVVLGWLEAVQTIGAHSDRHFSAGGADGWHAKSLVPGFAHRARIFWDLASKGWDTALCGGGMLWNPYVTPYKNAITNQLWIAASVSMYLYFPGDDNASPLHVDPAKPADPPGAKHDPKFLDAALAGYRWLRASNMTNEKGLYVDGFHIRDWRSDDAPGTAQCDERNDDVYTYNQGVILSGQRGLFLATGDAQYLSHGHALLRNVLAATGWSRENATAARSGTWAGLGRDGVLEEACDAAGDCSQNGQTFKGIFFHHLAVFCAPLPVRGQSPRLDGVFHPADPELAELHRRACVEYTPWLERNTEAALGTLDEDGKFGEWWSPGLKEDGARLMREEVGSRGAGGADYRNRGIPDDATWRKTPGAEEPKADLPGVGRLDGALARRTQRAGEGALSSPEGDDPNERGRGRTVETQSGGVAVLRAIYLLKSLEHDVADMSSAPTAGREDTLGLHLL